MRELIQEVVRVEANGQFIVLPLNFRQRLVEIEELLVTYFMSLEKKSVSFRVLSSLPTCTVLGLKHSQRHYRVICRKARKKDFYNIELIDPGITMKDINRDELDLYKLPLDMVHIPPISRKIQIFGVAPCCLVEEGVTLNLRQKGDPNGVMSSNALEQIENFIGKSKHLQCAVEIIGVSRKDLSLVYGDIQISNCPKIKSLKNYMLDINAVLPNDFCESDIIRFSSTEGTRLLLATRSFRSGLQSSFEPCQNISVKGEIKPSLDAVWWLNIQKKLSEKKKNMATKTLDSEVEYSNLGIKLSINQLYDDSRGRCPLLQTKSDSVNILGSGREKRLPRSASLPRHRALSLLANSSCFEEFSPPEPRSRPAIRSKEYDLKQRLSSKRESRRVTFIKNLAESFHSRESLRDPSSDLHSESVINQIELPKEVKQSLPIRAVKLRGEVDKNKSKSVTTSAGYKKNPDISMDLHLSATKNSYDSNADYSPSPTQSAHKGHLRKLEIANEQGIKSSPSCLSSGQAYSCVQTSSSPTRRSNADPSSKAILFGRKQFLESRNSKNLNEQGLKSKRPSLSSEQADGKIKTASCPISEGVNLSKKQNTFRILVEGKGKPPRRNHLSEYHFDDRLMRFLSLNKREVVLMSEAYIWPAIQQLRDTLIVQKVQTVYLIPLLNNLLSNDFPDDPLVIGPRNLIICASWEDCHQLGIEISKVLWQHKNELEYCCDLYGAFNDTSNVAKYTKRFDILAATLPAFMRLLDQHESNFTFSLDRCSAIVFENLDSLLRLHPDALARLLHYYSISKKSKPEILRQVIACTTKWNNNVRLFKEESMESPLLFFPNLIEGALYAGVKFEISLAINKSNEKEELLKIMSNQPHNSRVIIFTKQGPDVVDDLVNFLAHNNFAVEGVYRLMKQGLFNDVLYKWNNAVQVNKGMVIVCSDDKWSDLAICNAHRTIHFDINEHSRLDFSRRMAASLDYYSTDYDSGLLPSPVSIHSYIILSESGGLNILSDMLKVVERSGTSIPNKLLVLSNEIRLIKEKVKTEEPLCHTLKMFGECRDSGQCSQRHYVQKESDIPIGVSHGELIVRVTCVPEANVFNGIITKIINPDGSETENKELSKLEKDMLEYFNGPNGRMSIGQSCKVNSLYAFENEKNFMRVKVLEILKKEKRLGKPLRVAVKFIDTGRKAELDTYELLELPERFHSIPKQALKFICCEVKPSDMDRSFDIRARYVMEKKLLGSLIHGRIKLALGETIWLGPAIRLMIRSGKYCAGLSVKQMLVKDNLAEENLDHLENLYKLCKEGGLALPDYTHTVAHKRTQQAYRDFLHREDYTIVFISFVVNPNKFFVTRTDKSQFLENLEQELQHSALTPLKKVYNGLYCLAKFYEDGNLYRAQAVGEEEKGKVNVFFVDHGETESVPLSDLFEIDDSMLKKLPLQAIQCKLAGIEPTDGNEYSQEASEYFWDLTRDNDFMLEFSAIVLDKKENTYDVVLFQGNAELSERLVQKYHANRLFFTNVVLRSEESEVESETDKFESYNCEHFYDLVNYKPEKQKCLTKRREDTQSGASTASASASKLEGKRKSSSVTICESLDESDSEKERPLRDPRYDRLLPISDEDSSSSEELDFDLSDDENRTSMSWKTFDF